MRYLMATDGSAPSLKAARFMLRYARPGPEDEIFVAYVFPLPSDPECYEGVAVLPTSAGDDRVAAVAAPILQATMEILLESGSHVRDVCLVGNPAQEIVEFAMNLGIDLVVAGTRGRSPAKELYLGSVSSALVHRAPCSVLIVR